MHAWTTAKNERGLSVGFVPTMGALHRGHTALIDESIRMNDSTVLSIFVNPTQFNVSSDFDNYPRSDEADLALAEQHKVSCVYLPSREVMYPSHSSVVVEPGTASYPMEGVMRPGHFRGVTTVVTKLLNAVAPHRAYFGKKDYQQLAVLRQMISDLDFMVEIIGLETVREHDGLALSSRNVRLLPDHRAAATSISRGLFRAVDEHKAGRCSASDLSHIVRREIEASGATRIDYVTVCHMETLQELATTQDGAVICVAAWYGDVRLIDNVELTQL